MRRSFVVLALLCNVALAAPARRGVAIGLFSEDAGWSYAPILDEVARLGAKEVELVVPLYQRDVTSTTIGYHPRFSPPIATVRRTIREAHARKLAVLLFPIVRLVEQHAPDEWRGTLRPSDRAAWFASYGTRLLELAQLAKQERVAALSVGSELSTLDLDPAPWQPLVARVRATFKGTLTYSGNWDHFEQVGLYPLVDTIGVCAYFPLTVRAIPRPPIDRLVVAWGQVATRLSALSERLHERVLLTELGYRSQGNALAEPWDESAADPVDDAALETQRLAFEAFRRSFSPLPSWMDGFFVWNWYGWGGPSSRAYTPRGKPAEREVRELLHSP